MQDPDTAQESNTKEIMFARSVNGGTSFAPPLNVSNSPGHSQEARIAVDGAGTLFIVWDEGWPTRHLALSRSRDGGASFEASRRIVDVAMPPGCAPGSPTSGICTPYPGIAADRARGLVYLVWHDRVGADLQVLFSRSLDGGTSSRPRSTSPTPPSTPTAPPSPSARRGRCSWPGSTASR